MKDITSITLKDYLNGKVSEEQWRERNKKIDEEREDPEIIERDYKEKKTYTVTFVARSGAGLT